MSKPVVHLFCLHALATLIRRGTPSDGRVRVLDVGSRGGLPDGGAGGAAGQRGVRGDVLGIDVEETLVRLGRENYAADGLDLPVSSGARTWQDAEEEGRVPVHLRGRVRAACPRRSATARAPAGSSSCRSSRRARGARRLMVRRDLRGRLRRPETVCEASFVPLIDTRDFAPETRAL